MYEQENSDQPAHLGTLFRNFFDIIQTIKLTLKVPVTTAADNIHKYFFIVFQRKQDLMFQVIIFFER